VYSNLKGQNLNKFSPFNFYWWHGMWLWCPESTGQAVYSNITEHNCRQWWNQTYADRGRVKTSEKWRVIKLLLVLPFDLLVVRWVWCSVVGEEGWGNKGGEKNCIMRSLIICNPTQYCSGDKIEKNEMSGACSTYGGEVRRIQAFSREIWG